MKFGRWNGPEKNRLNFGRLGLGLAHCGPGYALFRTPFILLSCIELIKKRSIQAPFERCGGSIFVVVLLLNSLKTEI